jgi:hypothetical protein
MDNRTIKIKELIKGQVDMVTFGLVELELLNFEKEIEKLKIQISGKTFFDKEEVLILQIKDLELHNNDLRNDYIVAIKMLRTKFTDDEISEFYNKPVTK